MKFMHFSLLACLLTFSLNAADEPSYIFEAKGEFAKELKSLVEKYSKDAKVVSLTTDKVEDGTVNATVNRKTYELDTSTLDKSRRFASGKSNPFANTSITDGKTTNTNSGVTESRENTENNNENNKENKEPSTGVNIFKNKSNGK